MMRKYDRKILIIATAALEGGALTILKQFVASIPDNIKHKYVLFLAKNLSCHDDFNDFVYYKIDTSTWALRVYYDFYGYTQLIRKIKLNVSLCVNFQNIPARLKGIEQIVYMHQSLPFYDHKWNVFDKNQLKYWLYQHLYILFIKFNKKFSNLFVVQSDWIATALSKKINYPKKNIKVFKPGVASIFNNNLRISIGKVKYKYFIYPASLYEYKNHDILISAFEKMSYDYLYDNKIRLLLTIDENNYLAKKIRSSELSCFIKFIGHVGHDELNELYENAFGLLFPSKIESFGLPLIEAATKGINIITVNLPYATELISDYPYAYFCSKDDTDEWVKTIKTVIDMNLKTEKIFNYQDDWGKFQQLIADTYSAKNE